MSPGDASAARAPELGTCAVRLDTLPVAATSLDGPRGCFPGHPASCARERLLLVPVSSCGLCFAKLWSSGL